MNRPIVPRADYRLLGCFALLSLCPLLFNWRLFQDLYWFGDEWDQLEQILDHGFWSWVFSFFGENFAPMLKLTWGGGALLSGGHYIGLVIILWIAHAITVFLFGLLLRQNGFRWPGTLLAMVLLGLPHSNLETLGWTIQLITVQGTLFLLAAAIYHGHVHFESAPTHRRHVAWLLTLISAGTFSYVRGVLNGAALALMSLWPDAGWSSKWWPQWRPRVIAAGWCFIPAVVLTLLILIFAQGNHQKIDGPADALSRMLEYAFWYFSLNPFFRLLEWDSWGWRTTWLFFVLKAIVLVWAWRLAAPRQRRILIVLIAFDLGTALLLGIGRYHTGLPSANSSRYQYTALVCTLPFVAVLLDRLFVFLTRWRRAEVVVAAVLALTTGLALALQWRAHMEIWSGWRGREPRHLLTEHPSPPAEGAVPGIPLMTTERAKRVIEHYDLQ
jgi:hypothetical protein